MLALVISILGGTALRLILLDDSAAANRLPPYQQTDDVLTGPTSTPYQTLLEIVPEILILRDREGMWPEAELLAAEAERIAAQRIRFTVTLATGLFQSYWSGESLPTPSMPLCTPWMPLWM